MNQTEQLAAALRGVQGALEQMRHAALQADWHTFDEVYREATAAILAAHDAQPKQDDGAHPSIKPFIIKHYNADEYPILKGNGFDGLAIAENREMAEYFAKWLNARLAAVPKHEAMADKAKEVLEIIATPRRPDGTWNRDRESCRLLAATVLGR